MVALGAVIASFFITLEQDIYVLIRIQSLVALVTVILQAREVCIMVDVGAVIKSFFITLKQDVYVLIRIQSLVALVTVMFFVTSVMDIYLCRSRSSTISTIVETVGNFSDLIVIYLLGAMVYAGFENELFPVWAVVLVSLRAGLGYLSGYGIMDRERRLTEASEVIRFIGTGILLGTRASKFTKPLWSLCGILVVRSLYRYWAHGQAIISFWHGRSSEFLQAYLRKQQEAKGSQHGGSSSSNSSDSSQNLLVYGESKVKIIKPQALPYTLQLSDTDSLITLHKIQGCNNNKDLCMAFAMSRLLRCRLEVTSKMPVITLMVRMLLMILELELAFVRDYFYTLYPVVFSRGLCSLSASLLQSTATFAAAIWLAVGVRKVYKPEGNDFVLLVNGCNVDVIITWVFMSFVMFKEVWEIVTYLLSNWTRILLVCSYVRSQRWCLGNARLTKALMSSSFFTSKIADPWHRRIGQYDFLQSCTYKPVIWKLAHTATLGKTPEKFNGRKPGDAIKIHGCVEAAVFQEIHHLCSNSNQLREDIQFLRNPHIRLEKYRGSRSSLRICSQVILVWHIATSLCEIKLPQDSKNATGSSKTSFLRSVWSRLKNRGCCCSSQTVHIDENTLTEPLRNNYRIANHLSRYCAYLLVFQPDLLPDGFIVPKVIFEETLEYASKNLKGCNLTQCRYNTLMVLAQEAVQDTELGKLNDSNIVQQGAILANDLLVKFNEKEEDLWKHLADVWTKLLVHIAPNWNAEEAHKYSLESGGEFITLIWALLWHCGIEKSFVWHDDIVSESNAQAPLQNKPEIRSNNRASETNAQAPQQNSIDIRDDNKAFESNAQAPEQNTTEIRNTHITEEQDNDDEIQPFEDPETSNFVRRRRQSRNDRTNIEEQAQMESEARNVVRISE
ncbi:hypothetical protein ACP70R_008840 [Stipagrostis hirtigluma subsp. patula]